MKTTYSIMGQVLIDSGVITEHQRDIAVHKQQTIWGDMRIGEILIKLGYATINHITAIEKDNKVADQKR